MTIDINFKKYPLPNRFRHHTSPNQYLPVSELKVMPDYYPPLYEKMDWSEVFGNAKKPDYLDVGCGKGAFLLSTALDEPNKNILGIELRKTPVKWLETIIFGEKIVNCGVIWYSVVNGLKFIDDNSIDKVFYLFPDPWYKRKHNKRRVLDYEMLAEFSRVMKPGGRFYIATDVEKVDFEHRKILGKQNFFSYEIVSSENDWNLPVTNKEKFCRKKNIDIYRLICTKL